MAHRVQAARDNSYVGTFGEAGYGIKAQQVLGQVCSGRQFLAIFREAVALVLHSVSPACLPPTA